MMSSSSLLRLVLSILVLGCIGAVCRTEKSPTKSTLAFEDILKKVAPGDTNLKHKAEKLFRKKHGGGNPGTALKRSIANNLPNQVEFDALTSAYRLPTPSETEAINALLNVIGNNRSETSSFTNNGIFYPNMHPALVAMAMNIAILAADSYDSFDDIPLIGYSIINAICNLDYTLDLSLLYGGLVFDTGNYCVQDVKFISIVGNSINEIVGKMEHVDDDFLLGDSNYPIISGACASPFQVQYESKPSYRYYCWVWFIKMAVAPNLTSKTCRCTSTAGDSCTAELDPYIYYLTY